MIRIILYPPLAKGRKTIEWPGDESSEISAHQLIQWLLSKNEEYPDLAEFTKPDNPEQHLLILVNDKIVEGQSRLKNGDTVKLVPNLAGG